jgi:nicotinate-nucleotide adenylyltransferase
MQVGIYGGTFDPIHQGHLILAEQCREQGRLDQVWFVPAFRPPNKLEKSPTRFDHRVEMLSLAIAGNPAFRIDELEKERTGPSFTVDTLAELQGRHPKDVFWLLVGSDTLTDLPNWHEPVRLLGMVGLMVMARPGNPVLSTEELLARLRLPADASLRIQVAQTPLIDISSREIRRRVSEGRTVRYFMPRAVEVYVQEKGLYRAEQAVEAGAER